MSIQEGSKDAFARGDLSVHRTYLSIFEVIKEIYLSYPHQNWLLPPDILLYIPLRYFIDISEDIRTDIKKTLFLMVEAINQDRMPAKLVWREGAAVREAVPRGEYLQVILYFIEECRQEEEYIALPEVMPTNL